MVVAKFLNKLYSIVNDSTCNNLIRWSDDGESFIISSHDDFKNQILGHYFKLQNFTNFVRQLHMYGFQKVPNVNNDPELWEFKNSNFKRDQPELISLISRKWRAPVLPSSDDYTLPQKDKDLKESKSHGKFKKTRIGTTILKRRLDGNGPSSSVQDFLASNPSSFQTNMDQTSKGLLSRVFRRHGSYYSGLANFFTGIEVSSVSQSTSADKNNKTSPSLSPYGQSKRRISRQSIPLTPDGELVDVDAPYLDRTLESIPRPDSDEELLLEEEHDAERKYQLRVRQARCYNEQLNMEEEFEELVVEEVTDNSEDEDDQDDQDDNEGSEFEDDGDSGSDEDNRTKRRKRKMKGKGRASDQKNDLESDVDDSLSIIKSPHISIVENVAEEIAPLIESPSISPSPPLPDTSYQGILNSPVAPAPATAPILESEQPEISYDSNLSVVEISSINEEAAARAAEILRKHHDYIQFAKPIKHTPPPRASSISRFSNRENSIPRRSQTPEGEGLWTLDDWDTLDRIYDNILFENDYAEFVDVNKVAKKFIDEIGGELKISEENLRKRIIALQRKRMVMISNGKRFRRSSSVASSIRESHSSNSLRQINSLPESSNEPNAKRRRIEIEQGKENSGGIIRRLSSLFRRPV